MPILPALQSAALRLYGRKPAIFFGSGEQFEAELCDWANEVARDIAEKHDWQALVRVQTFSGNGEVTAYDMPQDYDRQLLRSEVQTGGGYAWGYQHVPDINDFLAIKEDGFTPYPGVYCIYGNQMHVFPAPATGSSAVYPYLSKNIARGNGGALKPQFTDDTDDFLLPDRLLTLGIIWRWRENKKLDCTADEDAFNEALSLYTARDKGSRIQTRNSRISRWNTYPAWPWELGPKL